MAFPFGFSEFQGRDALFATFSQGKTGTHVPLLTTAPESTERRKYCQPKNKPGAKNIRLRINSLEILPCCLGFSHGKVGR
jgi:hypothetical protein